MTCPILLAATLLLGAIPNPLQDTEDDPNLLEISQLEVVQYEVQYLDPVELADTCSSLVGRSFFVKERGGYHGHPVDSNIRVLGGSLVIYDTPEYAAKVLETLKRLDRASASGSRSLSETETLEYRPRYTSLEATLQSLMSVQRQVRIDGNRVNNLTVSKDVGLLIVRDTPERVANIKALLARIDVPKPSVLLTCYLLTGTKDVQQAPPEELGMHLKRLLPDTEFDVNAVAVLRTTTSPNRYVQLRLDCRDERSFDVGFLPVAFDRETGSLTVDECELVQNFPEDFKVFTTSTVFHGGEYTVLGSTGTEPTFLVVHLEPIGG